MLRYPKCKSIEHRRNASKNLGGLGAGPQGETL